VRARLVKPQVNKPVTRSIHCPKCATLLLAEPRVVKRHYHSKHGRHLGPPELEALVSSLTSAGRVEPQAKRKKLPIVRARKTTDAMDYCRRLSGSYGSGKRK
jgi:hypothetical protein